MLNLNYNQIKKTIFNKQKGFWRVAAISKLEKDKDKKNELGNKLIRNQITIQDKKLKKYSFLSIITEKKSKNNKISINNQSKSLNKKINTSNICDNDNNYFSRNVNNYDYFTPKNDSNNLNIKFSEINIHLFSRMYQHERNETEKIYTIKSLEKEFEKQYKKYKPNNNIIDFNSSTNTPRKIDKKKHSRKSSLKKSNKIRNLLSHNEETDKNLIKSKSKLKLKRPQSFITKNEANNKNLMDTERILDNKKILLKNSKSEPDFMIRKKFEKFNKKLEIFTKYKELMENSKKIQNILKSEENLYKLSNILKIRKIKFNSFDLDELEYLNNKKLNKYKNLKNKNTGQQTIWPFRTIRLDKVSKSNYGINFMSIYNSIKNYKQNSKNISHTDRTTKYRRNRVSFYLGKKNKNLEMKENEFISISNSIGYKKRRISGNIEIKWDKSDSGNRGKIFKKSNTEFFKISNKFKKNNIKNAFLHSNNIQRKKRINK